MWLIGSPTFQWVCVFWLFSSYYVAVAILCQQGCCILTQLTKTIWRPLFFIHSFSQCVCVSESWDNSFEAILQHKDLIIGLGLLMPLGIAKTWSNKSFHSFTIQFSRKGFLKWEAIFLMVLKMFHIWIIYKNFFSTSSTTISTIMSSFISWDK